MKGFNQFNSLNGIAGMTNYGFRNGGDMGAVMGFMGLPWMQRNIGIDGGAGYWKQMDPWGFGSLGGFNITGGGNGGGGGGGNPGTGGDGPGTGGNNGVRPRNANWTPPTLMYPPPIGTGAQWRNTMKNGA